MADVSMDLPAIVHSHCVFFDKLVELIPSKFYLPNEEASDTWTFKQDKAARLAAKATTNENLKKAKRNRLDPDKFKSTLQLLQEKNVEPQPEAETNEFEEKEDKSEAKNEDTVPSKERAVTYEDLRERLHKRIQTLRSKRHAESAAAATQKARTFQNEKKKEALERSLKTAPPEVQGKPKEEITKDRASKRQKTEQKVVKSELKKDMEIEPTDLEFGRVKMGLDSAMMDSGRKHRSRGTKEKLLRKATDLEEKMQDPQTGEKVISKHSWSSAHNRASGEKVLDNPKLLKSSMRRDKQQKKKSAKKWKERKDFEKKASSEKQRTRKENISQRQQSKKERAIAKREKKLMRPGFEGRKAGFINK